MKRQWAYRVTEDAHGITTLWRYGDTSDDTGVAVADTHNTDETVFRAAVSALSPDTPNEAGPRDTARTVIIRMDGQSIDMRCFACDTGLMRIRDSRTPVGELLWQAREHECQATPRVIRGISQSPRIWGV